MTEEWQSVIFSNFYRISGSTRRENCPQILWKKTNLMESLPERKVFFPISFLPSRESFWFKELNLYLLMTLGLASTPDLYLTGVETQPAETLFQWHWLCSDVLQLESSKWHSMSLEVGLGIYITWINFNEIVMVRIQYFVALWETSISL